MSQTVLVADDSTLRLIQETYAAYEVEANGPGMVARFKLPHATVTVYRSKKVLFQGAHHAQEASRFQRGELAPLSSAPSNELKSSVPDDLPTASVIGSDETGTGDFFGPITVAACYVPKEKIERLQELGVKDSKMLTDDAMRDMAPLIAASCIHSTLTLDNPKYNELQEKGYSQGKMKAMMHNAALNHVLRKMDGAPYDYILIDQFAQEQTYYNHLNRSKDVVRDRVIFATKAEQIHVSVAAASILARFQFLKALDALSERAGVTIPKGASAKVDKVAARLLRTYGESELKQWTKWHFANREKAKRLL